MAGVLAARRSLGVGPGRAWPHEWTAIKRLLACGAHESAAYQQPINIGDVKNAINLQERLQRVRQKNGGGKRNEITLDRRLVKTPEAWEKKPAFSSLEQPHDFRFRQPIEVQIEANDRRRRVDLYVELSAFTANTVKR